MPLYRLTPPGELLEADSARREGIHTTFRGVVLVMGRPREIVLRRVPASVVVEELAEEQDPQPLGLTPGGSDLPARRLRHDQELSEGVRLEKASATQIAASTLLGNVHHG